MFPAPARRLYNWLAQVLQQSAIQAEPRPATLPSGFSCALSLPFSRGKVSRRNASRAKRSAARVKPTFSVRLPRLSHSLQNGTQNEAASRRTTGTPPGCS